MRRVSGVTLAGLLVTMVAACSSGGGGSGAAPITESPCTLVARLDEIAANAAQVDVSDPESSDEALDAAVADYVETVQQLRAVAPDDLQVSLERVEAAVQQGRLDDAVTDRSELDVYAATECGRSVTATTTDASLPSTVPASVPAG